MQRYKTLFRDPNYVGTHSNVQRCVRLQDLDEIGDGHHGLSFDMLGLFSFRQLSVEQTVRLWLSFLGEIGVVPDVVTVHPDRREWERFYTDSPAEVREDPDCVWSDGQIGGYCTEMYVGEIEIGNIVNPLGDCIDVGFGLDRLAQILGDPPVSRGDALRECVSRMLDDGFRPSNKRQGYVLRRLLRTMVAESIELPHPVWHEERDRQERTLRRYERLLPKHPDKPPSWWWKTHGIEVPE